MERHLKRFITSGTVPSKSDCEKCLKAEPEALRNRDWKTVKFYVIIALQLIKRNCSADNTVKMQLSGMAGFV